MPGLQTPARELSDNELIEMIRCTSAVLVGAAYYLYDLAIAETMEHDIRYPGAAGARGILTAAELHKNQLALPRIEAEISLSWVTWATSTRDNWDWVVEHYRALEQSYFYRCGQEPHEYLEMRRLWMHGPRPRPAGRTPFPEEAC